MVSVGSGGDDGHHRNDAGEQHPVLRGHSAVVVRFAHVR